MCIGCDVCTTRVSYGYNVAISIITVVGDNSTGRVKDRNNVTLNILCKIVFGTVYIDTCYCAVFVVYIGDNILSIEESTGDGSMCF